MRAARDACGEFFSARIVPRLGGCHRWPSSTRNRDGGRQPVLAATGAPHSLPAAERADAWEPVREPAFLPAGVAKRGSGVDFAMMPVGTTGCSAGEIDYRDRAGPCGPPLAQIRTCGTTAYGSCLGCKRTAGTTPNRSATARKPRRPRNPGFRHSVRSGSNGPVFSLASPLPSTNSANAIGPSLFVGFLGTMELSDSPAACMSDLRHRAFSDRSASREADTAGVSRLPRGKFPTVRVVLDSVGVTSDSP